MNRLVFPIFLFCLFAVSHESNAYEIHGKVIDHETMEPLQGAVISIVPHSVSFFEKKQIIAKGSANIKGEFYFDSIPAGKYRVIVHYKNYLPYQPSPFRIDPHALIICHEHSRKHDIIIEMERGAAVTVQVLDENQKPVPNASVWACVFHLPQAITDKNGTCNFTTLRREKTRIHAQHEAYSETISEYFIPGSGENPPRITVVLSPPASISGRVIYKDGTPVKQAAVYATYNSISIKEKKKHESITDEEGFYTFTNLGAGTYSIWVNDNDVESERWFDVRNVSVTLKSGEQRKNVDFKVSEFPPLSEVKGQVSSPSGQPIANARFEIHAGDFFIPGMRSYPAGITNGLGMTDEEGRFCVKIIEGKNAEIRIHAERYLEYRHQFDIDGTFLNITMKPAGVIKGKVLNANSKHPIKRVLVQATTEDGYGYAKSSDYGPLFTYSDDNGDFILESVNDCMVTLHAQTTGYCHVDGPTLHVQSGDVFDDVIFEMNPGMSLHGIVVDSENNPIPKAVLGLKSHITNQNENMIGFLRPTRLYDTVRSDHNGEFQLKGISPDGEELIIKHPDFAPCKFPIAPELVKNQPVQILLTQGGILEGIVADSDGNLITGAIIQVFNFPENTFTFRTITDKNGAYRIEHLPTIPMMVRKTYYSSDSSSHDERREVIFEEGKVTEVSFGAGKGALIYGTVYKNGKSLADSHIILSHDEDVMPKENESYLHFETHSEKDGSYVFKAVPDGEWILKYSGVSRPPTTTVVNPQDDYLRKIVVTTEQRVYPINLYADELKAVITVTDAHSGEVLPDVSLHTVSNREKPLSYKFLFGGMTDREGRAVLYPKLAQSYELTAAKKGYQTKVFPLHVRPRDSSFLGDIKRFSSNLLKTERRTVTTAHVLLSRSERSVYTKLSFENKPFVSPKLYFSFLQNGYSIPINAQLDSRRPDTYFLDGFPEGKGILLVTYYEENNCLHSIPKRIETNKGKSINVLLNLAKTSHFQIHLKAESGEYLSGYYDLEIPGLPAWNPILKHVAFKRYGATVSLPLVGQLVRLKVPGYESVEFVPDEHIHSNDEGSGTSVVTLLVEKK